MPLHKRGQFSYGDSQADIRDEILEYSKLQGYAASHYADARCICGNAEFYLLLDDNEGAAVRRCAACGAEHPIGDSQDYLEDAKLEECACPCGAARFQITAGVSLYEGSEDVRWLYLACRCPKCGLTAVYGDWKNEFNGFQKLLALI